MTRWTSPFPISIHHRPSSAYFAKSSARTSRTAGADRTAVASAILSTSVPRIRPNRTAYSAIPTVGQVTTASVLCAGRSARIFHRSASPVSMCGNRYARAHGTINAESSSARVRRVRRTIPISAVCAVGSTFGRATVEVSAKQCDVDIPTTKMARSATTDATRSTTALVPSAGRTVLLRSPCLVSPVAP